MTRPRRDFDAAYYQRFYENPRTRSASDAEVERFVAFIAAYLDHLGIAVRSIADIGCGTGAMRAPLLERFKRARYTGVDVSEYACETYGWVHASVVDYRAPRPFDLVICHDVLQYLGDRNAARAIDNLIALSDQALVLAALTREDWDEGACDPTRTDDEVRLRSTRWYRQRLARGMVNVGGGLFLKRDRAPVLWSLEHLD